MRDLTGRLVWITGGGSGIGAAAARRLGKAGCKVVISGRRPGPLEALADARAESAEVDLFARSIESSEWGIVRGRGAKG